MKFQEGDRLVVVKSSDTVFKPGWLMTVLVLDGWGVGVEFDEPYVRGMHNLAGHGRERCCYWFSSSDLSQLTSKISHKPAWEL